MKKTPEAMAAFAGQLFRTRAALRQAGLASLLEPLEMHSPLLSPGAERVDGFGRCPPGRLTDCQGFGLGLADASEPHFKLCFAILIVLQHHFLSKCLEEHMLALGLEE